MSNPSDSESKLASGGGSDSSAGSVGKSKERGISAFAVYGTLRDDDDTGATWTAKFIEGSDRAGIRTGRVRGFEMHSNRDHNWPYALWTPTARASSIVVRYIPFPACEFPSMLSYADSIENYDPATAALSLDAHDSDDEIGSSTARGADAGAGDGEAATKPVSPLANPAVEIRYERLPVRVRCVAGGFCGQVPPLLETFKQESGAPPGVGGARETDAECGCGTWKRAYLYCVRELERGRVWTRIASGNWLRRPR